MSTVHRTVTLELQLDPDQIWEVDTSVNNLRMQVFYVKWIPSSVYVEVSGYVILSRDPIHTGGNWRKTIRLNEVPTQVKNQLIAACHPVDLAKS